MASFHFEAKNISRGKGGCIAYRVSYETGQKIVNKRTGKCYYNRNKRGEVQFSRIYLPEGAPPHFNDLQSLCDAMEDAESRKDARVGRLFIVSLPNELDLDAQVQIVDSFVKANFVDKGLCAIAAIHEKKNPTDPAKNNPHVHIIVSTRTISADGFSVKKLCELDRRENVPAWRIHWARLLNAAYIKAGLPVRVHSKSFKKRGKTDREPLPYLSVADYQKEKNGIRTEAGDRRREVIARNNERKQRRLRQRIAEREMDWDLSR